MDNSFLQCPICLDLAEDPMETSCCNNIFCNKCATAIKNSCPQCRSNTFKFKPSVLAKRMINSIEKVCEHCSYKSTIGDIKDHYIVCPKLSRKCSVKNCNYQGNNLIKHINETHMKDMILFFDCNLSSPKPTTQEKDKNNNIANEFPLLKTYMNTKGKLSRLGLTGKYYCGGKTENPELCDCDGNCGPENGCNCTACMELDIKTRKLPKGYWVNEEGANCSKK